MPIKRTVKPFQRMSVEIGAVRREWRIVKVTDLKCGDIVAGFGKVDGVQQLESVVWKVTNVEGVQKRYYTDEDILAFVEKK